MILVLVFYSDDPSSNLAEAYHSSNRTKLNEKEVGNEWPIKKMNLMT